VAGVPSVGSIKVESKSEYEIETSGYVPENPCPYGMSAPRRRSPTDVRIQVTSAGVVFDPVSA
jgi:hypothetical protein